MKVLIKESRLEKAVFEYLDAEFTPDYGWDETTQLGVDKWGDAVFFINDVDSYIYYGCNANAGPEDELFASYGRLHNYKCPLLLIYPTVGRRLTLMFGDVWKPIFKKWFENNTGLQVSQLTDNYI